MQGFKAFVVIAWLLVSCQAMAELQLYYVHNDHLGTPTVVTDGNQQVVWQGEKTPFGETSEVVNAIAMPIRFPGQYYDEESGLHYNYYRDYDPGLGRYVQSDPIGITIDFSDPQLQMALFGENLSPAVVREMSRLFIEDLGLNHAFGYVNQNPLLGVDPLGLVCISTTCPRVPKFPKDLLPHKKKIEQCLKGKGDRDDIPKDVREKAADYYQRASDALHRESSASNQAKNLNQARADYLRGKTNTPPGNTSSGNYDFYP